MMNLDLTSHEVTLAFDIGGSHIASTVISPGDVVSEKRAASRIIPADVSRPVFLDSLRRVGEQAIALADISVTQIQAIAVAVPAPFDYTRGICLMTHKHTSLYGENLRSAMFKAFGVDRGKISFLNDADAFLLGEISNQHFQDTTAIGITLGTGLGSAFLKGGQLCKSGPGVPPEGELWKLPWKDLIVEDFISSRALMQSYRRLSGRRVSVEEIAAMAADDPIAVRVFAEFGTALGQLINDICCDFEPALLILGGGIARSSALFVPYLQEQLTAISPVVLISQLSDLAALQGAVNSRSYLSTSSMRGGDGAR